MMYKSGQVKFNLSFKLILAPSRMSSIIIKYIFEEQFDTSTRASMQSKISDFFKSSASAPKSVDPPSVIDGDGNKLEIWEKKEHQIFNIYERRPLNPKRSETNIEEIYQTKKPTPIELCSKQESTMTGRTIIKNKKRSYAQFHMDFGQSDFLLHNCSTCGVKFAPGDAQDEKAHKEFHKNYTKGVPFKAKEVVKMIEMELGTGWIIHELCKVYLFISLQRIVGCLVAEPIKEAFKVISCSVAGNSKSSRKKETNSYSTLQFGDIIFQREVEKRASLVNESMELDKTPGGAIFCENKAVAAVCGIRAIWVTPSNRRKRIANQLLDALRKSFCMGFVLEHTQIAFSQPTSAGKALGSSYSGTGSFLVYKANQTES